MIALAREEECRQPLGIRYLRASYRAYGEIRASLENIVGNLFLFAVSMMNAVWLLTIVSAT